MTGARIISDIKPHVHERDKSWGGLVCVCLVTHSGSASHANLGRDTAARSVLLPHHDLLVTASLNTSPC